MSHGSLESWLYSENQSLDIMQRLNIMFDVACGLEYLHHGNSTPIVYCDLKSSNVLLDDDMVGHVSDFGISKLLGDDRSVAYTITMATIGYIAPGDDDEYNIFLIHSLLIKKFLFCIHFSFLLNKNWQL